MWWVCFCEGSERGWSGIGWECAVSRRVWVWALQDITSWQLEVRWWLLAVLRDPINDDKTYFFFD
jgi:hypothetical protein